MKVLGVGTDIIEVARVEKAFTLNKFRKRVFTDSEISYFAKRKNNFQTISGFFAAKEAISKSLKIGFGAISPNEIEIEHDLNGAPLVKILNEDYKNIMVELSISHTKEYAVAYALSFVND